MQSFALRAAGVCLGLLFLIVASPATAQQTLVVDPDGAQNFGDACDPDPTSVDYADVFQAMECSSPGDTIQINPGTYSIFLGDFTGDTTNNGFEPPHSLDFIGAGRDEVVLAGASPDHITQIRLQTAELEVAFRDLTLERLMGGGFGAIDISEDASLTLERVRLTDSAWFEQDQLLRAREDAELVIKASLIDSNEASMLIFFNDSVRVRIRDTVVRDNKVEGDLVSLFGSAEAEVVNSVFTRNAVESDATRRILSAANSARLDLAFVTIAANTGEIRRGLAYADNADGRFSHVLVAEPEAQRNCRSSSDGDLVSLGHNVSDADTGNFDQCDELFAAATDRVSVNTQVLEPADTGGGVISVPLGPGSEAIDAGNTECLDFDNEPVLTDIRGFARPTEDLCTPGSWQFYPGRGVSRIVIAATDPDIRYAAVLAGGVFRSNDGGENWALAGEALEGKFIVELLVDPDDADRVWASVYGEGVWFSDDGGNNWQDASAGLEDKALFVNDLSADPGKAAVIFAATDDGLYRSTDAGANWEAFGTGLPE